MGSLSLQANRRSKRHQGSLPRSGPINPLHGYSTCPPPMLREIQIAEMMSCTIKTWSPRWATLHRVQLWQALLGLQQRHEAGQYLKQNAQRKASNVFCRRSSEPYLGTHRWFLFVHERDLLSTDNRAPHISGHEGYDWTVKRDNSFVNEKKVFEV